MKMISRKEVRCIANSNTLCYIEDRKAVRNMATKSASVTARIQPEIKDEAEAILEELGIPVSVFIDMTYRQVIAHNGIPFSLTVSRTIPTRDSINKERFDSIMQTGLQQARKDESTDADDFFYELRSEL